MAAGSLWACALVLAAMLQAQDEAPAVAHAKRVVALLNQEQYADVAKEFTPQMTAALTPEALRTVWTALRQQAGSFTRHIDSRVTSPTPAITTAVLECEFERIQLNVIVSFDSGDRIAGLRFTPRAAATGATPSPVPDDITEEQVTIGTARWQLPGTLSFPKGPIVAAVVLVHGSGPSDRDETIGPNKPFRDLAWGLASRGVAVLRYEKRTRQYGMASAADRTAFTVRDEVTDDALAAASFLRAHARLRGTPVFVLGHSLGGTLAPRIAAEDPALAGLVIMAGATRPLLEAARDQFTYLSSLQPGVPVDIDAALSALRAAAPESYWKDLDAYNPAQAAAALTMPMLILQGGRDYQVTGVDLDGWRKTLDGRTNVTIRAYPALNHLFMAGEGKSTPAEYTREGHVADAVIADTATWMGSVARVRR